MRRINWVAPAVYSAVRSHMGAPPLRASFDQNPLYMYGEDSARCDLTGLEKEWPAHQVREHSLPIGVRLSHQIMLGGYQIETSFTALLSDRFLVKVNKCSSAVIVIVYGAR